MMTEMSFRVAELGKSFGHRREGTASVEFVLLLPLLALMLFGTIDLGRMFFDYHAASKSVRDAARYLSRSDPADLGVDCATDSLDQTSTAITEAKNLVLTGKIDSPSAGDYLLGYWTNPNTIVIALECATNDGVTNDFQGFYAGAPEVPAIVVTAEVPFSFANGYLFGHDGTVTLPLRHKVAFIGQ